MCAGTDQCPVCAAEEDRSAAFTVHPCPCEGRRLRDLPEGARTHVRELRGCGHLRLRLYALGLTPGAAITVRGRGEAGCRVEVRGTCVTLDRESADIIVCDEEGTDG